MPSTTMIFNGNIKSGKLEIYNRKQMKDWIATRKDGLVRIQVRQPRVSRSINQNDYFHGVLLKKLGDELGYEIEEMKGVIKWLFHVKSTSDLSSTEFEDLCRRVRRWAAIELNINLPEPNETDNEAA